MKTNVRYEFDNGSFFPRDFNGSRSIKLIDPPVIPATGDEVHIRMDEFFEDADLLSKFNDQSEGQVYYAERMNTIIGKTETARAGNNYLPDGITRRTQISRSLLTMVIGMIFTAIYFLRFTLMKVIYPKCSAILNRI
jgi:hypothetical protein